MAVGPLVARAHSAYFHQYGRTRSETSVKGERIIQGESFKRIQPARSIPRKILYNTPRRSFSTIRRSRGRIGKDNVSHDTSRDLSLAFGPLEISSMVRYEPPRTQPPVTLLAAFKILRVHKNPIRNFFSVPCFDTCRSKPQMTIL